MEVKYSFWIVSIYLKCVNLYYELNYSLYYYSLYTVKVLESDRQ